MQIYEFYRKEVGVIDAITFKTYVLYWEKHSNVVHFNYYFKYLF